MGIKPLSSNFSIAINSLFIMFVMVISIPAVESLLHRAKENLAEKLKKLLG
jgi:hypothetical protein